MEEYFGSFPLSNATTLCVGGITEKEAEIAREDGLDCDGMGYYLFLSNEDDPQKPIEVLAKFTTNGAAEKLARLFKRAEIAA